MLLPYLAIVLLVLVTVYSAVVSFRGKPEGGNAGSNWVFPDRTRRPARIFIGIATFIFVIGLVFGLGAWFKMNVAGTHAPSSTPRSWRFLIPEGYSGWGHVEFEIPGAPPLPEEAGQTLLKLPPSGSLETSSSEQYGWARDIYIFYSSQGVRPIPDSGPGGLIWGKLNGEKSVASGKRKYEEFFVGTEKQFKDQIEAEPKDSPRNSHSPSGAP